MLHFTKPCLSRGMQLAVYDCNARLGFKIRGAGDDVLELLTVNIREVATRMAQLIFVVQTKVHLEICSGLLVLHYINKAGCYESSLVHSKEAKHSVFNGERTGSTARHFC